MSDFRFSSADILRFLIFLLAGTEGNDRTGRLGALLWEQHRYLLAMLRYKTGDGELAEDLLQETYVAFFKGEGDARSFADEKALRNYLVTIALNKLRDHFRKQGTRTAALHFKTREDMEQWLETLVDTAQNTEADLVKSESDERRRLLVAYTMESLPETYRRVLELKFTRDLGNSGIADELGIGIKAVESLLFRAKKAFAKEFETLSRNENESLRDNVSFMRRDGLKRSDRV